MIWSWALLFPTLSSLPLLFSSLVQPSVMVVLAVFHVSLHLLYKVSFVFPQMKEKARESTLVCRVFPERVAKGKHTISGND